MNRFTYVRAENIDDAVKALAADPDGKIIAGGTNLIDLMKYNVERPTSLVDVTRIKGLSTIEETDTGGLKIGALVPNTQVASDPRITSQYPLLSSAILAGATPQLRNAASTGGNLNQRTRCYYFYDPATPCNKREPGTGCPAIGGVNRIHAILGQSEHCIATHPSDMCVALAALEAVVHVTGPGGDRVLQISEYHRLPGDRPDVDTTLGQGEIVTGVELPAASGAFASNYTYLKLRDRLSYAFALVSVAVGLEVDGNEIRKARVAIGGVAHKPWRRPDAEHLLVGKPAEQGTYDSVAVRLLDGAKGYEHNAFKIELAHKAIVRALEQAAAGKPQSQVDKRIR